MVKIYIKKITNKAINPNTGKVWRIEDVPARWREEVKVQLADSIE